MIPIDIQVSRSKVKVSPVLHMLRKGGISVLQTFLYFSFTLSLFLKWREVARELEGVIRIGAVNCEDDWHLCRMQGIRSYPSLIMYPSVSDCPCTCYYSLVC